jgi:hypothetical protein
VCDTGWQAACDFEGGVLCNESCYKFVPCEKSHGEGGKGLYDQSTVYYVKYEGNVVMQARDLRGLWLVEEAEKDYLFLIREKETAELWHRRFKV